MTMQVRKSEQRGDANHGWLKSKHTFSFADYYDPKQMGFRSLRVINEDRIDGGTGFGSHPHRDMEIISYVVKGALEHQDSMGNKAVILPGEVQRLSAGTGIVHSEKNQKAGEVAHFFQIWIMPKAKGDKPGYGQKSFEEALNSQKMVLVVSEDARDGSIGIRQDADLYISRLKANDEVDFKVRKGRGVWIQVVKGDLRIEGGGTEATSLKAGDGFSIDGDGSSSAVLKIKGQDASEFMLFDLL